MIIKLAKRAVSKFKLGSELNNVSSTNSSITDLMPAENISAIEKPNLKSYLFSEIQAMDYLGPVELSIIADFFAELPDEEAKIANAKILLEFFSKFPEKGRLIASSYYYLLQNPFSASSYIIFIASNYSLGKASWCIKAAKTLKEQWSNSFTTIILARVLKECEGLDKEYKILEEAYQHDKDTLIFYNLIANLIDSDRVEEANKAIETIKPLVEKELADEIAFVKVNQPKLEEAIEKGQFAPDGDSDIYTDEMCLNNWIAYYESFVTRKEHVHGDRLILNHFLRWLKSAHQDIDVVLDFGTLCAQPLYEAAELYPKINFFGTDRQKFIADMNNKAYPAENLAFDHGDIFEVMKKVGAIPGRKALVHIRTTCTLYPKFVEELYKAAKDYGFTHIYMIENAGLVRTRLQFMDFNLMQEQALVTKHQLNIHNYRQQLDKAGFRVKDFNRLSAPGIWRGEHAGNYLGSQYEIHAISS